MSKNKKDINLLALFLNSTAAAGFALISTAMTASAVVQWQEKEEKTTKEKAELVTLGAGGVAGLIFSFLVATEPIPPRRRKEKKSDNSPEEDSPEPPQT